MIINPKYSFALFLAFKIGQSLVMQPKTHLGSTFTSPRSSVLHLTAVDDEIDDVFNSQFKATKTKDEVYRSAQYWKGKPYNKVTVGETDRNVVMKDFDRARLAFLRDSVFVIAVGFAVVWSFGTLKDVRSYGFGSILGLMYSLLLGRFVENLGNGSGGAGGSARFAPVILLIAVYGKFKTELNLVPELLGFFTYQVSSFLQAFNEDLYEE